MKKEFLEDYKAKEEEQQKIFLKVLHEGKFRKDERYPPKDRLKLNEPYTESMGYEKLWYQILFYGTTIIELHSIEKHDEFEKVHGFGVDDIDRLIDLAKIGKVNFVLGDEPTSYENMDFFEGIFTELQPPKIIPSIPPSSAVPLGSENHKKSI